MTCKKCGTQFEGNFCPVCGTRLDPKDIERTYTDCDASKDKRKSRKKSKAKIILVISIIIILLAVIVGVLLCLHSFLSFKNTPEDPENTEATLTEEASEEYGDKMIDLIEEVSRLEEEGKGQQEIKTYLEGIEWIKHVSETEDGGLTCVTEFGVTGVWSPEVENTIGNIAEATHAQVTPAEAVASSCSYDIDSIAILCPYASVDSNFNLDGYNSLGETMDKYTDCEVSFFKDEEVSLDLLKNLDQYDMVWFYSHGALSNVFNSAWAIVDSDPYTMTGEFADSPAAYVLLSNDFFSGRTVVNLSDGRIGVGGNFYKHYYSKNQLDGVFFHFASCNSMRTDRLADGLLSRGAVWVEGWDNSVYFNNDYMQFTAVLANLLDGNTVEQAIKNADSAIKDQYDFYQEDCHLTGKGERDYKLIIRDDFCEDIIGTYKGSYFANQGETGLTLTVYKEDQTYKALFDFYNLPGRSNAQSGKYYMDVSYDIDTDEYSFTSTEWIIQPDTYGFVDLKGKLAGDVLSGDSPTSFSVTKTTEESSPSHTVQNIPTDAFEYNGHYYKLFVDVCATWEEAEAYCEQLGGHLAVISSQEENDAIFEYLKSFNVETAYFGFSDVASEGTWVWVTGEPHAYTNWHSGEPNSEGGENYAEFYWQFSDGTWNDGNFGSGTQSDSKNFICEWD